VLLCIYARSAAKVLATFPSRRDNLASELSSRAGRNRHEHICQALELFASDVMPEFRACEIERDAAKVTLSDPLRHNPKASAK
jgi:hypothetical protein